MALLLRRRRRRSICRGRRRAWRARLEAFAAGPALGRGLREVHRLRSICTASPSGSSSGSAIEDIRDTIDIRANMNPVDPARRDVAAHGPVRGGRDPRARARRARGADARPFHAVCRLLALRRRPPCSAASPICRPARASGIRWAARAPWPRRWRAWARSSASTFRPGTEVDAVSRSRTARSRGVADRHRRAHRLRRRSSPTWTRCAPTASWSAASPARAYADAGLRARLLRRRALSRPVQALRPPRCTTTSCSPATPRRSSTASTDKGEPAPDPTCYLAAPVRHRTRRRAARRRGALCAGAHALSAAAPRLASDVPGLSAGDPRQAEAHRRACRTSRSGSCSSAH